MHKDIYASYITILLIIPIPCNAKWHLYAVCPLYVYVSELKVSDDTLYTFTMFLNTIVIINANAVTGIHYPYVIMVRA